MTEQPYVAVDPDLVTSDGQPLWTTEEMVDSRTGKPTFAMHEVANCFFGRSTQWLRKHLRPVPAKGGESKRNNISEEHGEIRPRTKENGIHFFLLYDIERLAWAFYENGVIDAAHLASVVKIVKANAEIRGFLKSILEEEIDDDAEFLVSVAEAVKTNPEIREHLKSILSMVDAVKSDPEIREYVTSILEEVVESDDK